MDLRQLVALRAVAGCGSVARAAELLGWSQPTVTHHLRGLARELGSPVVAASPGGTALTPVGAALLPHAHAILDRAERAVGEVRQFAEDARRRVRLGVFPTAAARILPALLARLRDRGFGVTVREAEVGVLREDLADLRIDAAVLYTTPAEVRPVPVGFDTHHLFTERLVMLLPRTHPRAAAERARLFEFAGEDWILGAHPDEPLEQLLTTAAGGAGFVPRAAARSDDYQVVSAYVASGFGVALVPESVAPTLGEAVVGLPLEEKALVRHAQLVANGTLGAEVVRALVAGIADARAGR